MPRAKLNPLESKAYDFIVDFQHQHKQRPPNTRMSRALECSYSMTFILVGQLAAKGWISIEYDEHGNMRTEKMYHLTGEQS